MTTEQITIQAPAPSATDLLDEAAWCLADRASARDTEKERSMAKTIKTFNQLTGRDLTEADGWVFMVVLKLARAQVGMRRDDFVDGAAYMALAGESALKGD